jgi:hypothetical protein
MEDERRRDRWADAATGPDCPNACEDGQHVPNCPTATGVYPETGEAYLALYGVSDPGNTLT